MNLANPNSIEKILEEASREFVFSAYQLVLDTPKEQKSFVAGIFSYENPTQEIQTDSNFDLASLTKVICTVSILARFLEQKRFSLQDSLQKIAPEWRNTPYGNLLVCDLLSHCSGLKNCYPL